MILDGEALNVMAGCISRGEKPTIDTQVIETDVWCEECRMDSAARAAVTVVTPEAVYEAGTLIYCVLHDRRDE